MVPSNILVAKLTNGQLFTTHNPRSEYVGDLRAKINGKLIAIGVTDTEAGLFALCDAEAYEAEYEASGRSVFEVSPKTEVPGANTIIPPTGVTIDEIGDSDLVVHHP